MYVISGINRGMYLNYLNTYVKHMIEYDVNSKYNERMDFKDIIEKFLRSKQNKYPIIRDYFEGRSQNYKIGGGRLKDIDKKTSEIIQIIDAYTKIDVQKIAQTSAEITRLLTNIDTNIKTITESNIEQYVNPYNVLNEFETTRLTTEKINQGINIGRSRVVVPFETIPLNLVNYDMIIKELNDEFKKIKDSTSDDNSQTIKVLLKKIELEIEKIEKDTTQKDYLDILRKEKKIYENSLNYNVQQSDIKYTDTFENFKEKIIRIEKEINGVKPKGGDICLSADIIKSIINRIANKIDQYEIAKKDKSIKGPKERDIINLYNQNIYKITSICRDVLFKEPYNLPIPCFNGNYTSRITNNFLESKDTVIKIKAIETLINATKKDKIIAKNLKSIYKPDFDVIVNQMGGSGDNENDIKTIEKEMEKIQNLIEETSKTRLELIKQIKEYNSDQIDLIMHTMFLTLIATNQIFGTGYVMYDFIGRGTFTFYKRILSKIRAEINTSKSDEILYLKKYHYVTIQKLSNFVNEMVPNMNALQIIDIHASTGEFHNRMLLLNYFRYVLDAYNQKFQDKITIYARINDIDFKQANEDKMKLFLSDKEYKKFKKINEKFDESILWVVKTEEACSDAKIRAKDTSAEPISFTEVFDTDNFPTNNDVSKYMTLDTQLSIGKGVAIMTYGYSGTGKTYTLFGSSFAGKAGLLQATLDNITGLENIAFRVYEIYGLGIAFKYYWDRTIPHIKEYIKNVYNKLYHYKLELVGKELKIKQIDSGTSGKKLNYDTIDTRDIPKFVGQTENLRKKETDITTVFETDTYFFIPGHLSNEILQNFDIFINDIEKIREEDKRVRDTPNNKVSSRSVLVYDFQLYIKDNELNPIPFLIIDLPGREEIIETYIDPYMDNPVIEHILGFDKDNSGNEKLEYKFMLACMFLNPLGVPLFDKTGEIILQDFFKNITRPPIETKGIKGDEQNSILDEKIKLTFKIFKNGKNSKDGFEYSPKEVSFENELINTRGDRLGPFIKNNSKIPVGAVGNRQKNALIGVHLINRLMVTNNFYYIKRIYERLCKSKINDVIDEYIDKKDANDLLSNINELWKTKFKGGDLLLDNKIIKRIIDENNQKTNIDYILNNIDTVRKNLKDIMKYDYYLTPFEGLYINENIIGLVKYLAEKMIHDEQKKKEFVEKNIIKQNENLSFAKQQINARIWLMSPDPKKIEKSSSIEPKPFNWDNINEFLGEDYSSYNTNNPDKSLTRLLLKGSDDESLKFNYDNMVWEYEKFSKLYVSDSIFNFDKPLITDILAPYIAPANIPQKNDKTKVSTKKSKKVKAASQTGPKTKIEKKEYFPITDYKVFYLFANYYDKEKRDLKCYNQYKLLKNTENFITTIAKQKKI